MHLTILGSGTGVPRRDRKGPAYLLSVGKEMLLLDCSMDAKQQMANAGAQPRNLSRILITHMHADHAAGLGGLFWSYGNPVHGKKTPITLYGPKGFRAYFKTVLDKIVVDKMPFKVSVREMGNSRERVRGKAGFTIESKILLHTKIDAIGYRIIHKGKIFVYSGDACYSDALVKLSKNADMLLLDCAVPKPDAYHLSPEQCGIIAAKAGVKKLVLTHFYPEVERIGMAGIKRLVRKNFGGKTTLARDLMRVKI